jgi:hypothetical protein
VDDFGKAVNETTFYFIRFKNYLFTNIFASLMIASKFPEKKTVQNTLLRRYLLTSKCGST